MELFEALLTFAGAVAVHALLARLPGGNPITKFLLAGGTCGLALAAHLLLTGGPLLAVASAVAIYAFACELYLFLFTMVASSISARLLLILRQRPLKTAEIQDLYEPRGMVERRLERLVAAGLLHRETGGYRVTERGRRLASRFLAVKGFFHPNQMRHLQDAA